MKVVGGEALVTLSTPDTGHSLDRVKVDQRPVLDLMMT